ncbi:thiol:disulfide interchange protein DsbD [Humidesulfovibrio mexicanus]|uniref:Thiol:disulfide interchange protein DsbD n=2 Tax=Humidesulfovibrio mexicanus TaxID=147047 RepID=A0A238XM03_9BACT|nr:thiol:disulfide interchange protein DsbD [Humidesulfovibrio mexicanus]
MSRKFLTFLVSIIISTCCTSLTASAMERHGDLPLGTQWTAFELTPAELQQTGLMGPGLVVLFVEPDRGWYTYTDQPGEDAKPTRLQASMETKPLTVLYPPGVAKENPLHAGKQVFTYIGRTPLFVPLPVLPPSGDTPRLAAQLDLLLCSQDKCLPVRIKLESTLPAPLLRDADKQPWWPQLLAAAKIASTSTRKSTQLSETMGNPDTMPRTESSAWADLRPRYFQPELEVSGLVKAVLLGVLAGFILNFMPCVLPVISIKLSALLAGGGIEDAARRRSGFRRHNLFFAFGIMLYFLFLGGLLGVTGLAWGQIFQQANVVMLLITLVFILSLSLFGVFSLPVIDLKFGQHATHPRLQALFTGLLATLLATPCSGPLLGGVLGWTLMQPAWIISSVLAAIGVGMAFPYLLLSLYPDLARLFPKPGSWTGHVEKAVGLFLAGTCLYLLSILPTPRLMPTLVLLWFAAVAGWAWGVAGPGFDTLRNRSIKIAALLFFALGLWLALRPPETKAPLEPFATAALRERMGRQTVLVDFTADWCPSCKALEQTTLTPERLRAMKNRFDLALMKADLTQSNPDAERLLEALGSKSIPLLAVFPKNAPNEPLVLRDLFTPAQLEEALTSTARQ